MSKIKIEWRNPPANPPVPKYQSRYIAIARVLKTRPGVWACVHRGMSNTAGHAREKLGPDFEVVSRMNAERVHEIFARYQPRLVSPLVGVAGDVSQLGQVEQRPAFEFDTEEIA